MSVTSFKDEVASIGTNPTFKAELVPMEFIIVLITVDIYELTCLKQWEGRVLLLWTLFLRKKYNKNIDDV